MDKMTDTQEKGIHLLYKKLGDTPFQCVEKFKNENSEYRGISMTYAGRLDPMAEGLLLVLSGEKIMDKEKFLGLSKTYEFEILWEIETDSLDVLGVPVPMLPDVKTSVFDPFTFDRIPETFDIRDYLKNSVGKFDQSYPAYSSQPVEGLTPEGRRISKPLVQWVRDGKINEVKIPSHEVEIFKADYVSRKFENGKNLLQTIQSRINLVAGDFRQEKILEKWKKMMQPHLDRQYALDTVKVSVSGGFYVRQFTVDLAKKLGTKALTFHILRTEVGEFGVPMPKLS